MKISQETIAALKNFSEINQSIIIKKGTRQKTLAIAKNILASVDLADNFPTTFGIYSLSEFLNLLSSMEDPDIEFGEKSMIIRGGDTSVRYVYTDQSNIHPEVTEKEIDEIMPEADLEFTLTNETIDKLKKMAGVLSLEDVVVTADQGHLIIRLTDLSYDSHNIDIMIGDYEGDADFSFNYKIERFKLLPDDYEVSISRKRISRFVGKNNDAEYLISLERSSQYDENS